MPLPIADAIQWIENLGWNITQESGAPLFPGPYIQPMPDRIVTLSPAGGPGYVLEGDADSSLIQARTRGGQNDQDDAEQLALALDALIRDASFPVVVNGTTISHCHRFGSPPTPLTGTPDDGSRWEYVASYLFVAS